MNRTLAKFGAGAVRAVFGVFFLVMCGYICTPLTSYWHADGVYFTPWKTVLFALVLAGLLAALCLAGRPAKVRAFLRRRQLPVLWGVLALLLVFQLVVAVYGYVPIGFDSYEVVTYAGAGLHSIAPDSYLMNSPNNFMLVIVLRLWWELTAPLFGDVWLASVVLNILFVDAAIFFIAMIARRTAGARGLYLSLFFAVLLLGLSPYILVPYSDMMSTPLVAGFVYFALLAWHTPGWRRVVYSALAGFAMVGGYTIKPTVVIVGIAVVCVVLLVLLENGFGWLRAHAKRLAVCAVCASIGLSVLPAMNAVKYSLYPKQMWEDSAFPMTHFFMMGLKGGGFDEEDRDFTVSLPTAEEKRSVTTEIAMERLQQRLEDGTLLPHLWYKTVWSFADGTFTYGGEGWFHQDIPPAAEGLRGLIHQFTYTQSDFYRSWYCNYQQGLWLLVCLLLAGWLVPCPRGRACRTATVLQLAVLGLWLFLMLFECRARYLLQFMPLFILLAGLRAADFERFTERKMLQ